MDKLIKHVRDFYKDKKASSLLTGSPGPETLSHCKDILLKATTCMLEEDIDHTSTFCYGPDEGDLGFRQQLAAFLTQQYGDIVINSDHLAVTAGATQALHMVTTILLSSSCPVFMEDPTYFGAYTMIHTDLNMQVVPVPCDDDGIDTEALDRLLTAHAPKSGDQANQPFWAMIYTIPVYNNPTGGCYSPSRCRRLVELARKHNVLVIAEDVYNLIHFGDSHPPKRLLAYDDPSDPDYKGHVLSSGSFSKILAPGLRLGWVEGPEHIIRRLHESFFILSGGSPNHYISKVAATALKLGLQTQHLHNVREIYKKRRDAVCKVLRENLPQGATFLEPQGGFFIWIKFPEGTDTMDMVNWMMKKYRLFFLPGLCSSIEGKAWTLRPVQLLLLHGGCAGGSVHHTLYRCQGIPVSVKVGPCGQTTTLRSVTLPSSPLPPLSRPPLRGDAPGCRVDKQPRFALLEFHLPPSSHSLCGDVPGGGSCQFLNSISNFLKSLC